MKLKVLAAVVGILAAVGSSAAAAELELMYNGEFVTVTGEIVNDRAMVDVSSLQGWGAQSAETDGVWTVSKNGGSISYSERTGVLTGADGAVIEFDTAPIFTSNGRLLPLRAIAGELGMAVGWDQYADAIVLVDYDVYFEQLKIQNPEFYQLLMLTFTEAKVGAGSTEMTFDMFIQDELSLALKLVGNESVKDGVSDSSVVLESLKIESQEFNLALSDLTLDGVFDIETKTIYLKTNALEKIRDAVPSTAEQIDAVIKLLPGDKWYKITLSEYLELMGGITGVDNSEEMMLLMDKIYNDGFCFADVLRDAYGGEVNTYTFAGVEELSVFIRNLIVQGILEVRSDDEDNLSVEVVYTPQMLKEFTKQQYEKWDIEWTDGMEQSYDNMVPLDLYIKLDVKDGIFTTAEFSMKMGKPDSEYYMNMSIKSEFDATVTPDAIELPESAMNIKPLLEALLSSQMPVEES